eukprot:19649_1
MEASLQSSLGTLYLLVGSISAISSISIILYILHNKCRRNTIQRFIAIPYQNIALSDLLFAISNICTGPFEETKLNCAALGYLNQLGAISSFLWVLTTLYFLKGGTCRKNDVIEKDDDDTGNDDTEKDEHDTSTGQMQLLWSGKMYSHIKGSGEKL